jgi:hypothetical protein
MSGATLRLHVVLVVLLMASGATDARLQTPDPLETLQKLLREARFSEVESSARSLLAATEAASGADSIQTARVLDVLVESLWRGGKMRTSETKALAQRAVSIKEAQLGPEHPDVGVSLTTLGIVLRLQGDYLVRTTRAWR